MSEQHISHFGLWVIAAFLGVVHLGGATIVHFTKYFICQWLPLQMCNLVLRLFKQPVLVALCDRPRKFLTQAWAWFIVFELSLHVWPIGLFPVEWSLSQTQIAAINAVINPLLVWGLFAFLSSNDRTKGAAELFGAKVLDLQDAHEEMEEAGTVGEAAKTVIRNVTGLGKPGGQS